jgi:hypothetical protein
MSVLDEMEHAGFGVLTPDELRDVDLSVGYARDVAVFDGQHPVDAQLDALAALSDGQFVAYVGGAHNDAELAAVAAAQQAAYQADLAVEQIDRATRQIEAATERSVERHDQEMLERWDAQFGETKHATPRLKPVDLARVNRLPSDLLDPDFDTMTDQEMADWAIDSTELDLSNSVEVERNDDEMLARWEAICGA